MAASALCRGRARLTAPWAGCLLSRPAAREAGAGAAPPRPPGSGETGPGSSGVLRGARAARVGVGRGCSLQGAGTGLRGRQRRGCEAIGRVRVEVRPPVSFAQRQVISFAKTRALGRQKPQGDRSRRRKAGWGETEAELRTRRSSPAAPFTLAWLRPDRRTPPRTCPSQAARAHGVAVASGRAPGHAGEGLGSATAGLAPAPGCPPSPLPWAQSGGERKGRGGTRKSKQTAAGGAEECGGRGLPGMDAGPCRPAGRGERHLLALRGTALAQVFTGEEPGGPAPPPGAPGGIFNPLPGAGEVRPGAGTSGKAVVSAGPLPQPPLPLCTLHSDFLGPLPTPCFQTLGAPLPQS